MNKLFLLLFVLLIAASLYSPPIPPAATAQPPAPAPLRITTNGEQTIFRVRWDSKYSGVYYADVAGTEYEIEINDNLSMTTPCDDPQLRQAILTVVQYFADKNE